VVSRFYGIGRRGRVHLWGPPGWLVWLVGHLVFLTGFKNRAAALFSWIISFFGRSRYERTITLQQVAARRSLKASPPPALNQSRQAELADKPR
jgi:NADH dehydrogenase